MGRLGVALLLAAWAPAAWAEEERGHCTALGVGRKATSTGSTLLAHTDDRRARAPQGATAARSAASRSPARVYADGKKLRERPSAAAASNARRREATFNAANKRRHAIEWCAAVFKE